MKIETNEDAINALIIATELSEKECRKAVESIESDRIIKELSEPIKRLSDDEIKADNTSEELEKRIEELKRKYL